MKEKSFIALTLAAAAAAAADRDPCPVAGIEENHFFVSSLQPAKTRQPSLRLMA